MKRNITVYKLRASVNLVSLLERWLSLPGFTCQACQFPNGQRCTLSASVYSAVKWAMILELTHILGP